MAPLYRDFIEKQYFSPLPTCGMIPKLDYILVSEEDVMDHGLDGSQ